MQLTKRQKICLAVLGVAGVALVLDRAVLSRGPRGGPASAAADETATGAPLPRPSGLPAAEPPKAAPSGSLVDKLQALAKAGDEVADAFALPAAWRAELGARPRPSAADVFGRRHRLTAVMLTGRIRRAVVDDTCLAVGEVMDGFRLIAVDAASATFVRGDARVTLRLPTDGR
jgi:hypothetical protein